MKAKHITNCLSVAHQGQMIKFYTDIRLYESIIFHVLSNAVKFSPSGGVIQIEVDLEAVSVD